MKTLAATLVLSSLFFISPAIVMAGTGHDHGHAHEPVKQEVAEQNAGKVIASLVERSKIEKSWSSIKASSVEQKKYQGKPEWVAIYDNEKIADTSKQKLYVFLTPAGEYIAANYTGN